MQVGRLYSIAFKAGKPVEEVQAMKDQILSEIVEMENVERARFTDEPEALEIFTVDGEYSEVMNRIVNIASREGDGATLSFLQFVPVEE